MNQSSSHTTLLDERNVTSLAAPDNKTMAGYAYSDGSATSETPQVQQQSRKPQKKLSGARLARKREIDRQAQRSARVKTKNLIAHLESRIEELTRVHDSGNVKGLIDQLEEQRKQNEELRSTLQAIGKLVGGKTGDLLLERPVAVVPEDDKTQITPYASEQGDSEQGDPEALEQIGASPHHHHHHHNHQQVALANEYDEASTFQTLYDVFADLCTGMPVDQVAPPHTSSKGPGLDISQTHHPKISILGQPRFNIHAAGAQKECQCCHSINITNEILSRCSKMQLRGTANQRARDADIAIRAVLHGWESVTQKYLLDPVWAVLRLVDQAVFVNCGRTERLAIIRLMILMLRYRANRCDQNLEALPFFLRELPAQRLIPHTPLIDFLVWPSLRERFVLYPHQFCSEKFFSMFWNNFRFIWIHDFRDAYIPNYATGLYQFSTLFAEQTFNLQHWRMSVEFLEEFSELKDDMPSLAWKMPEVPEPEPADPFGFEEIAEGFGTQHLPDLDLEINTLPSNFFEENASGFPVDQNIRVGGSV